MQDLELETGLVGELVNSPTRLHLLLTIAGVLLWLGAAQARSGCNIDQYIYEPSLGAGQAVSVHTTH